MPKETETAHLFASGHTACSGCGQSLGARLVLRAAGRNIIATDATGCLEVFSSLYPFSAWEVPWVHSLFENSAAVASGVEAALKYLGKLDQVKVIAQGGDGSTADIGFGALSGLWERGQDVLYVCYDNEAYMNTGVQRSGLTPYDASTSTTPAGKLSFGKAQQKKDLPMIAVAHGVRYVATASVAYPFDLDRKVKKALGIRGPKYIQVCVPCPLGWRHDSALTIQLAKLVVETGLYPLFEYEDGKLVGVRKIGKKKPVEEYLRPQGRFRHLFETESGKAEIARIQAKADANIERFGLMEKPKDPEKPQDIIEKPAEKAAPTVRGFTPKELSTFDGRQGRPAYIAYKGKVYDISASPLWRGGAHQDQHLAGRDLTAELAEAPHGEENLAGLPVMGEFLP
ncbi:MAG: pyruvate ferredoxin oxidoreductase [Chloroflexi bacterium]|nr:pyruvate ferredoxin oxidoreductase [Chloroflexota bacterium]